MEHLGPKNVAVVGHGPSAGGCGDAIDRCDFVVRMTGFWFAGPEGTGDKTDAYAWFGAEEHLPPEGFRAEHWMTLPASQGIPPGPGVLQWGRILHVSQMGPMRSVSEPLWLLCQAAVIVENGGCDTTPTTGFVAVAMAIELFRPQILQVWGFDATTPNREGWGDGNAAWQDSGHDFFAEKRLLAKLKKQRIWLGRPCETRLLWHGMPQGLYE